MENCAWENCPEEEPRRYPNIEGGGVETRWSDIHRPSLLQGVKDRAKKPTNVAKTTEVLPEPDESLDDFYKTLCEAFCVFTPFDPETPEHQ